MEGIQNNEDKSRVTTFKIPKSLYYDIKRLGFTFSELVRSGLEKILAESKSKDEVELRELRRKILRYNWELRNYYDGTLSKAISIKVIGDVKEAYELSSELGVNLSRILRAALWMGYKSLMRCGKYAGR